MHGGVGARQCNGGVKTKGIPWCRCTREFREEAVRLVVEEKPSLSKSRRRLSLPPSTSGNWVELHRAGKPGTSRLFARSQEAIELL